MNNNIRQSSASTGQSNLSQPKMDNGNAHDKKAPKESSIIKRKKSFLNDLKKKAKSERDVEVVDLTIEEKKDVQKLNKSKLLKLIMYVKYGEISQDDVGSGETTKTEEEDSLGGDKTEKIEKDFEKFLTQIDSSSKSATKVQTKDDNEIVDLTKMNKKVLSLYSIRISEEEEDDVDSDEEGKLVIEENPSEDTNDKDVVMVGAAYEISPKREVCSFSECTAVLKGHNRRMSHEALHCVRCAAFFTTQKFRSEHERKHCPFKQCESLLENDKDRMIHKRMHQHEKKPFQCLLCKKRYQSCKTRDKHISFCKVASKKKLSCPFCGKSFFVGGNYEEHVLGHTRRSLVDRGFKDEELLNKVISEGHDKDKIYFYFCTVCPNKFKTSHDYLIHIGSSHFNSNLKNY